MSADPVKRLNSLLKRLRVEFGEKPAAVPGSASAHLPPDADPLVEELVYSFLLWESTNPAAKQAHLRLRAGLVDYNELRVCLPIEVVELIGHRDARSDERAQRLRAALSDLYRREHAVTLRSLANAGKREIRQYLDSLEGVPSFVAARTVLVAFGGHAVPVDDRLCDLLIEEGVAEAGTEAGTLSAWLERHVRSTDSGAVCALLQAWSDSHGVKRSPRAVKPDSGVISAESRAESKSASVPKPDMKLDPKPGNRPAKPRARKAGAK